MKSIHFNEFNKPKINQAYTNATLLTANLLHALRSKGVASSKQLEKEQLFLPKII